MRYSRNLHKIDSVKQRNTTASTTASHTQSVNTRRKQNHTKRPVLTRKWLIFPRHLRNSKEEMSAFWPDLHNFISFYFLDSYVHSRVKKVEYLENIFSGYFSFEDCSNSSIISFDQIEQLLIFHSIYCQYDYTYLNN